MRAIGYRSTADPDDLSSLVEWQLPDPQPGPSDLLVQVEAVSVNPVDTKVRRRERPAAGEVRVLGWDAAGTVLDLGPEVQGFAVGDRVWYAGALQRPGCNSELHLVDHRLAARRPSTISAAQAASLPLTAITAWELLFDRLRLQQGPRAHGGELLLVIGAAGGVGSVLVQLAKQLTGLELVATASRPESEAWLRQLGVEHVINHHRPLAEQLEGLGLPAPRWAISLTHSGDYFAQLVELLAPQGALALIDDPPPEAINVMALKRKSLSLHLELMFTRSLYGTADQAQQGALLAELAQLVDAGRIRPTLTQELKPIAAAQLQQAHRLIETGSSIGKLVVSQW